MPEHIWFIILKVRLSEGSMKVERVRYSEDRYSENWNSAYDEFYRNFWNF